MLLWKAVHFVDWNIHRFFNHDFEEASWRCHEDLDEFLGTHKMPPPLRPQPRNIDVSDFFKGCHSPSTTSKTFEKTTPPGSLLTFAGSYPKMTWSAQMTICWDKWINFHYNYVIMGRMINASCGFPDVNLGRPSATCPTSVHMESRLVRGAPSLIKHNGYGRTRWTLKA